ncbi:MAG: aspartate-semialdehyde dehydrogenase, partial [Planctomycetia bacterium]|nr:aspartate-semialdehyde dehydrogenase [Planctomycetia bacterium]
MFDSVAVVGATGAVGTLILRLLQERKFPYKTIKFVASARSAGKKLTFNGQEYTVEELKPEVFDGVQLVIASTPDDTARDFVPEAVKRGCLVVDESGYWRMNPT